ncbi:MAG: nucleotidyltransferase domain-containing protein [Desulfatiglandales bacterium]
MKLKNRKSLEHKEEMAIEVVARTLKSQFPVEEIILFGSKARGDHDAFSDIDLLLVTTKPLHWKEEKAIVEVLFEIGMTHDVIFTPLFVSNEEWKGGLFTQFPIYSEILRDGAVIP